MKKLSQQILLNGAIFFVLAISSFNLSVLASTPEEPPVITLAKYIPQLKALAAEKHAAIQEELASLPVESTSKFTICKAALTTALQKAEYLLQFADNAEKNLNIYKVLNDTIISGSDLALLKQQILASERDSDQPPSARRRLVPPTDQPLVALVMVFNKKTPEFRFDTFGEFEYARPLILRTLAAAFPGQDLDSIAAKTIAWIKNVDDYDLNEATSREAKAIKELERLAGESLGASPDVTKHWERERDLGCLEIEIVEDSEKLWNDLAKRFTVAL